MLLASKKALQCSGYIKGLLRCLHKDMDITLEPLDKIYALLTIKYLGQGSNAGTLSPRTQFCHQQFVIDLTVTDCILILD